jgi:hypothetical protein
MAVSFTDFWQPEKYFVYPLDKSYPYAIICNQWANKKCPYQNRQHSTVVVHPTCNRKVVGSNPTAGLIFRESLYICHLPNYLTALTLEFSVQAPHLQGGINPKSPI